MITETNISVLRLLLKSYEKAKKNRPPNNLYLTPATLLCSVEQ